jgi:hypothetical protein
VNGLKMYYEIHGDPASRERKSKKLPHQPEGLPGLFTQHLTVNLRVHQAAIDRGSCLKNVE